MVSERNNHETTGAAFFIVAAYRDNVPSDIMNVSGYIGQVASDCLTVASDIETVGAYIGHVATYRALVASYHVSVASYHEHVGAYHASVASYQHYIASSNTPVPYNPLTSLPTSIIGGALHDASSEFTKPHETQKAVQQRVAADRYAQGGPRFQGALSLDVLRKRSPAAERGR